MKYLLVPAFIAAGASTAAAQTNGISAMIAERGLAETEAVLASMTAPDASARFALGGVRFLGAIETALQTRYNTGINEGLAVQSGLPILRLPLLARSSVIILQLKKRVLFHFLFYEFLQLQGR